MDEQESFTAEAKAEAGSGAVAEPFRLLVQHSPDMVSIYDATGRFVFASGAHERILGYPPDALVGRYPLEYVHPDDVDRVGRVFTDQIRKRAPTVPVEFRMVGADGRYRHLEAVVVDLTHDPVVGGVLVSSRDVSDRRRAEAIAREQAAVLEGIARAQPLGETLTAVCAFLEREIPDSLAAVVLATDSQMEVVAAPSITPAVHAILDRAYVPPELGVALGAGLVVAPIESEPPDPLADAVFRSAGLVGWWGAPIFSAAGAAVIGSLVTLRPDLREPDPVERQLLQTAGSLAAIAVERDFVQARLAHQATHDSLTRLPNRDHLLTRLREIREQRRDGLAAVYFLDLDRFKVFNDSAGHDVGDRILVDVADRLRATLRDGDVVARFGGDEFVVVCEDLSGLDEVAVVAERMLQVIAQPFVVDDLELVVTASIGVAVAGASRPDELLRDADTAMYHAKDQGRARFEIFDDALRARVVDRHQTERDLRRALAGRELVFRYQPVVALETGRPVGFEALLRWEHPVRGLLPPADFLGVAEETGLMSRVGAVARAGAFRQWAQWRNDHPEWGHFLMAVNLAAGELRDRSLPGAMGALLGDLGVDPRCIVIEVTEQVLAGDTEVLHEVLTELRALGVLLALDDFGTGSSPLLHLRGFPINAIKLDGALVAGLGIDRDDDVIAAAVVDLAHRLGHFVVAEGVEEPRQAARLRAIGCRLAQGHAFAPALTAAEAEAWAVAHHVGPLPGAPTR